MKVGVSEYFSWNRGYYTKENFNGGSEERAWKMWMSIHYGWIKCWYINGEHGWMVVDLNVIAQCCQQNTVFFIRK